MIEVNVTTYSLQVIFASVYDTLFNFAQSNLFGDSTAIAFGSNYDIFKLTTLRYQWQNRDFSQLPPIEVISSNVLGTARGAYAANTNKIYLADSFINTATPEAIKAVILEEIGHYLDAQINETDTPGDEGEYFAALVMGKPLTQMDIARLQSENDHAVVSLGGELVAMEMSFGIMGYMQFGSSSKDFAYGISTDSNGNVYVTGYTEGSLSGNSNLGGSDAFVAKYDTFGTPVWLKQFGTVDYDYAYGTSTDSSGNVYVIGETYGNLGGTDVFVAKYDGSGIPVWQKQFGSSANDYVKGISTDSSGNVYVTGSTSGSLPGFSNLGLNDAFVAKYNESGTQIWIQQFGSSDDDDAYDISADSSGNTYITGITYGSLPGNNNLGLGDVFVAKYDGSGVLVWIKQFGTSSNDSVNGISTDSSGNIYVAGSTSGSLSGSNLGGSDTFVAKYNASGAQLWIKQFGTPSDDYGNGISIDSNGNIYVTGDTSGSLSGNNNLGGSDAFVAKYNESGTPVWLRQLGTSSDDNGNGISTDSNGNVYVTGYTLGSLPGNSSLGSGDAFIVGFDTNGNLLMSTLTINDVTITEDSNGTKNAIFTVTLNVAANNTITVNYATADGTATAGSDYIATSGTLTFAASDTTKTIAVPIIGDTIFETDETFFVNLTNATNAIIADAQGIGTILNYDSPTITLAVSPNSVSEDGATNLVYTFTRSGSSNNPLTVNYTVGGTTTFNNDYTQTGAASFSATTGTITFGTGSSTATLTIDPTADTIIEPNETIAITLATGTGYTVGTDNPVTGTIVNDDVLNSPVYRFSNQNVPGTHFYTASEAERENVVSNYPEFHYDGIAFLVGISPGDNLLPVHRFANQNIPGTHFYTASEAERQNVASNYPEFKYDGIAYYVYDGFANLGTDVYRFSNQNVPGTHFYTASQAEYENVLANYPQFRLDGVAYEVNIL